MYEELNLKEWPFQIVPDEEFAKIWAGRPQTKKQIGLLLRKMQFIPKSGLHLLWANFGMGKTHTLLHIQYLCEQTNGRLIPVYAVMPKKANGFLEVYRAIVSQLPYGYLGDQLVAAGQGWSGSMAMHPLFSQSPGVVNALLAIRGGDTEKGVIAKQWIMAQPGLTARELRKAGITYRIKTPEDAINTLDALTNLAIYSSSKIQKKLIVMLDEFQRIGELRTRVRDEINAGLHSYYNDHPKGLEIILSFSFGRQDNMTYLLNDALNSRAEPQQISLDVLSEEEAVDFLKDLLLQFRIHPTEQWAYPFSEEAIYYLIHRISQTESLTPRRLMQYSSHVLLESVMSSDFDRMLGIRTKTVENILSDSTLYTLENET